MPLLLLPERRRLGSTAAPCLLRLLARADTTQAEPGDDALLQHAFDIVPRTVPAAALTRQHDCGDAAHNAWLRADPGHVRADMGMGRLLALGDMGLTPDEVEALLRPLRPLFGDEGFPISAPVPSRWYLMLPRDARLPAFAAPEAVLGDDLYTHLPQGDIGRRWRRLLNEAQVILHNHPVNAARAAQGRLAVNTLWFWGGGVLPSSVRTPWREVCSDDPLLRALAMQAGAAVHARASCDMDVGADTLVDLRDARDAADVERDWLEPLLQRQRSSGLGSLRLAFLDGLRLHYLPNHRWRFWRRPAAALG